MKPEFREDSMAYLKENGEGFEYVIDAAEPVDKLSKMIFNYIISGYARVDEETASGPWLLGRAKRANSILKFMIGKGSMKELGERLSGDIRLTANRVHGKKCYGVGSKRSFKKTCRGTTGINAFLRQSRIKPYI